jgi:hypothetical protein
MIRPGTNRGDHATKHFIGRVNPTSAGDRLRISGSDPSFFLNSSLARVRYVHGSGLLQDCYRDDGSAAFVPCGDATLPCHSKLVEESPLMRSIDMMVASMVALEAEGRFGCAISTP